MIRCRSPLRTPALLLLVLGGLNAQAEGNPYYVGLVQGFAYDSNVFRSIDALAESSWWGSTGVVGGFDQPYRRQRFYGSANVQNNYYSSLKQLDNTSYAVDLGWDWETIEKLSGTLSASFNQNLGNYGGQYDAPIRTKNTQNRAAAFATANYGLLSLWQLEGRLAYSSVHYSARQYDPYELDQASATLGVKKQFSGQLTLGTGAAYTQGDYFSIDQQFDRYDLFLTGRWHLSGLSTLSGRLGYSWWDYTGRVVYDTSSFTGWLRYDYVPTGKLSLNAFLSYDTLANAGLYDAGPGYQGDSSRLTTTLQLGAVYQASAKVQVTANLNYYTRQYDRQFDLIPGNDQRRDRVTYLALGANWTPRRNLTLACNLNANTRNQYSDQDISLTPYNSWGGGCTAQFVLQ